MRSERQTTKTDRLSHNMDFNERALRRIRLLTIAVGLTGAAALLAYSRAYAQPPDS